MNYKERKILIFREGWTIQALADEYTKRKRKPCSREEMSQCIRAVRTYQSQRDFLSELFGIPVNEMFSEVENAKAA